MLTGKPCAGSVTLERYGVRILRTPI